MQQVCRLTESREVSSRSPGTAAGSVMDLHHFPNGPWPSSTQSNICGSVVLTVRPEILSVILIMHKKMYPSTDSSNHSSDIPNNNRGRVANSSSVVRALLQNDDTIALRSIIRRTRDVRLVSEGTSYERVDGALEEPIEGIRAKSARPFPP